jgi:predicted alpha-1,2-mannosidase
LARALGKTADYELFLKRAGYYKNVFRVEKGLMWPKDDSGKWIEPLDVKWDGGMGGRDYFDENNGYTYQWDVLHDFAGLFALMGGRDKAQARLDQLFREPLGRSRFEFWSKFPDSTGMVGQFSMGNEPSFSTPYLYNRLGAPWKTQKRIRMLIETFFPDTFVGIPGDEDGGAMSAYVLFSMMGFYPVSTGMPLYDVGSPVFDRVELQLSNGKTLQVVARNTSRDNKYVQSLRLNGKPMDRLWFRHADVAGGGTLEIEMGSTPNRTLGVDPAMLPPDSMAADPREFAQ